jgi:hypothetical protein
MAIIAVTLLVGLLVLPSKAPAPAVSLLIVTNAPKGYHSFFTAFLTNNTSSAVGLDPILVQLEDQQGRVLNNLGEIWAGTDGKQLFTMPPRGIAAVSPQTDRDHRRVRLVAEYSCDAPGFPQVVSRAMRRLPLKLLPRNLRGWFANHGFLDGKLRGRVESSWMLNPSFQRTPDRPSGSNPDARRPGVAELPSFGLQVVCVRLTQSA